MKNKKKWTSQWLNIPYCEGMDEGILVRITHLRRQMLLHCYIYYTLDNNLITDHEWQARALELYELQRAHGWNIGFYDSIFKHWTGQSGYWLPTNELDLDENVARVANRLVYYHKLEAEQVKKTYPHVPTTV